MSEVSENRVWEAIREDNVLDLALGLTEIDDINMCNEDGHTLLVYAVLHNKPLATELLIGRGADVNLETNSESNDTPLLAAVTTYNTPIMTMLLDAGASPTLANSFGETPLRAAAGKVGWELLLKYE